MWITVWELLHRHQWEEKRSAVLGHECQVPGMVHSLASGWQVPSGLLLSHSSLCLSKSPHDRDLLEDSMETIFIHEYTVCKCQWPRCVAQLKVFRSATVSRKSPLPPSSSWACLLAVSCGFTVVCSHLSPSIGCSPFKGMCQPVPLPSLAPRSNSINVWVTKVIFYKSNEILFLIKWLGAPSSYLQQVSIFILILCTQFPWCPTLFPPCASLSLSAALGLRGYLF